MSARDALSALLGELGEVIGIGRLELDEGDGCALAFDERLVLNIAWEEETGLAALYVELGGIRDEQRPALHAAMLAANFAGRDTGGGALGIDPRSGAAVLVRRVDPRGLTAGELEHLLERLVGAAAAWMTRLAEPPPPAEEAQVGPETMFQGGLRA